MDTIGEKIGRGAVWIFAITVIVEVATHFLAVARVAAIAFGIIGLALTAVSVVVFGWWSLTHRFGRRPHAGTGGLSGT